MSHGSPEKSIAGVGDGWRATQDAVLDGRVNTGNSPPKPLALVQGEAPWHWAPSVLDNSGGRKNRFFTRHPGKVRRPQSFVISPFAGSK